MGVEVMYIKANVAHCVMVNDVHVTFKVCKGLVEVHVYVSVPDGTGYVKQYMYTMEAHAVAAYGLRCEVQFSRSLSAKRILTEVLDAYAATLEADEEVML